MTPPIVGIGELLWDIYPDGRKVAGGAPFNFAFHCHQLGHEAVIVSRVGDDYLGRELRDEVRRFGLSDEYIQTDHDHPTGSVTVALDANKVPTYTINDNVAWDYIEWNDQLEKLSKAVPAICFGTLAQRNSHSGTTIIELAGRGADRLIRICDLNLRAPFFNFEVINRSILNCDFLKINHHELRLLVDMVPLVPCEELSPAYELQKTYSISSVYETRGADGLFISNWREFFELPGVPANVIDTVGAGDAFTAATVCLHLEGKSLRDCARFANHYAARVCEHQGATPRIDRADVERSL